MKKKALFSFVLFVLFSIFSTRVKANNCYYSSPFLGVYRKANSDIAIQITDISPDLNNLYIYNGSEYCSKAFCVRDAVITSDENGVFNIKGVDGNIIPMGEISETAGLKMHAYKYLFLDVYNDFRSNEHTYNSGYDNSINNWHLAYASVDSMHSFGLFQEDGTIDLSTATPEEKLKHMDNPLTTPGNKLFKTNKCPRYIIISKEKTPLLSTDPFTYPFKIEERSLYDIDAIISSLPGYNLKSTGALELGDNYLYQSLYSTYEVFDDSVEDMIKHMSFSPDSIVLALTDFNMYYDNEKQIKEAKDYNKSIVIENLKELVNITINRWGQIVEHYEEQLKKNCASAPHEWFDYVNLKNYSDKDRDSFLKYVDRNWPDYKVDADLPETEISRKFDVGMPELCWNTRRDLAKAFYTGGTYSLLSFFDRNGDAKDYTAASKKGSQYIIPIATEEYKMKFSETIASKYKKLNWYYFALIYGVDVPFEEFKTSNKTVEDLEDKYKEKEESCKIQDILLADQCAYLCKNPDTNKIESKYYEENCKTKKDEIYKKCKESYDACNCADCENSSKNPVDEAKIACRDNCKKCIADKKGSYVYSDWLSVYHDSIKKCGEAEKSVKDQISKNQQLYDFDSVEPMNIIWHPIGYDGNCDDVIFLHYIWNVIIIGAPFLVIILGSIDFFKNIINSNDDQKRKNKKNFIRRLIALVLLILVPFIIKLIVSNLAPKNSSASNIKLMQCIVNGE
ncbi:MAG: hypothetical protein IJH20_06890 [Bacilli bacterium]|nr:hypothetical protein [Bacilli bacterium]